MSEKEGMWGKDRDEGGWDCQTERLRNVKMEMKDKYNLLT